MSGRRGGEWQRGSDTGGDDDRKPGLSRRVVVIFGAMLGSYIAGKVWDVVKGRR